MNPVSRLIGYADAWTQIGTFQRSFGGTLLPWFKVALTEAMIGAIDLPSADFGGCSYFRTLRFRGLRRSLRITNSRGRRLPEDWNSFITDILAQ